MEGQTAELLGVPGRGTEPVEALQPAPGSGTRGSPPWSPHRAQTGTAAGRPGGHRVAMEIIDCSTN